MKAPAFATRYRVVSYLTRPPPELSCMLHAELLWRVRRLAGFREKFVIETPGVEEISARWWMPRLDWCSVVF